jgi:hypothetical protein
MSGAQWRRAVVRARLRVPPDGRRRARSAAAAKRARPRDPRGVTRPARIESCSVVEAFGSPPPSRAHAPPPCSGQSPTFSWLRARSIGWLRSRVRRLLSTGATRRTHGCVEATATAEQFFRLAKAGCTTDQGSRARDGASTAHSSCFLPSVATTGGAAPNRRHSKPNRASVPRLLVHQCRPPEAAISTRQRVYENMTKAQER